MAYDFFISHASRLDTKAYRFIRAVIARLKASGCEVFLDSDCLRQGDPIGASIRSAIEQSCVGVIMLSPSSAASGWVEYETYRMLLQSTKAPMKVWVVCLDPSCNVPSWIRVNDVFKGVDYHHPEKTAEEILTRFKSLCS